jgi:hypothetical protein
MEAEYALVSGMRVLRLETASRNRTISSPFRIVGNLAGVRAYAIRSGISALPGMTPKNNRSAHTVWFNAGHDRPDDTRCS